MPILDLSQYFRQYIKYKCMLLGIEVDRLNFLKNCFLSQCYRLIVSFLIIRDKNIMNCKVVQRITKPPIKFIFLTTFTYLNKNNEYNLYISMLLRTLNTLILIMMNQIYTP